MDSIFLNGGCTSQIHKEVNTQRLTGNKNPIIETIEVKISSAEIIPKGIV